MTNDHFARVAQAYQNRDDDFMALMQTVLSAADDIGINAALALLERCAIDRRLAWIERSLDALELTGDPVQDAYRVFYEVYLGVSAPEDGEIVAQSATRMVTRWWNACPLLDACVKLGLDTREICRKTYEQPVQVMFSKIDPRLKFARNYDRIRPHAPYCEEIIALDE
jgi:hypothetical protein